MSNKIVLAAIVLIGILLRVININSNPPALYGDELTIVLDAYSILKTGQDQTGASFPLTFSMGAGRPAGYVYGSVPFVAIFGPTALGVRALSILSGIGIIILLYYIGRKLFSTKLGLAAALIAAVSPWDISLSRGGFEAHFALFLSLLGFYLFMKAQEKPIHYVFSALSFGLTLHTYPTYKVSLLLFIPLLFWLQNKRGIFNDSKKWFLIGTFIFLLLGVTALSQTFIGGSEERFSNINIFAKEDLRAAIVQKVNFERSISSLPKAYLSYFHNKPIEYTKIILENYLQNFSLDFLVIHGDRNPRHNMATMGGIYFADAILILLGIIYFWQRQKKLILFLIMWLILAPIPTAFVDTPHALRSSFMLPPLILLSSLELTHLIGKNRVLFYVIGILFVIQFVFFLQKLYFLAPNEYSFFWSYPAKEASQVVLENKDKFDYIILSDKIENIEFAYPVYNKIAPAQVIQQNRQKTTLGRYEFKKFDKVHIGYIPDSEIEDFINNLDGKILFIGSFEQALVLKRKQ